MAMRQWISKVAHETGWASIASSPRDVKLICAQRFVRMFAYGSSNLVLAIFLSEAGISIANIGLFMTLTLGGDAVLSFGLTMVADRVGRRKILTGGAALMVLSGLCFSLSTNWLLLVLASVFGVISPSGSEIGPFKVIEESILAQLTPKNIRSDIFAWYSLIGSAGAALGILLSGQIVQFLEEARQWSLLSAYRAVFVLYIVLGLLKTTLTLMLSSTCELNAQALATSGYEQVSLQDRDAPSASSPTGGDAFHDGNDHESDYDEDGDPRSKQSADTDVPVPESRRRWSFLPTMSEKSDSILARLCLLFAVDSFASGMVPLSWVTYYFIAKFDIDTDVLGLIFFIANILAAISGLVASSLARRIGLIKTMVFTHLPSAFFLALIPVPTHAGWAAALVFLRNSLASMDQAPRQAFISTAVLPSERTVVMGIINVVKTLVQSAGPTVTGNLGGENRFWVVFLVAGSLKATYDLAMLWMFLGFKSREDGM